MKKVDTLFHGTSKIDYLISILKNGFYSSYANEEISNRKMKILMVSFSNVALLESQNQVSYGRYFIGLKRDWAIKKGIQPVAYTYEGSKIENAIWNMIRESAVGQVSNILKEAKMKDIPLEFEGSIFSGLAKLDFKNLNEQNVLAVNEIYKNIYSKVYDILLYLKSYVVLDAKGDERMAYNDREWRYVPDEVEEKIIFETGASLGEISSKYDKWSKTDKPHYKENPLSFNLEDISFIITQNETEIEDIYKVLFDKYKEENVLNKVRSGSISIIPFSKMTDSL